MHEQVVDRRPADRGEHRRAIVGREGKVTQGLLRIGNGRGGKKRCEIGERPREGGGPAVAGANPGREPDAKTGRACAMAKGVIFRQLQAAVGLDHRRSEEHTSELQSLMRISYAVFCLKKKQQKYKNIEKEV